MCILLAYCERSELSGLFNGTDFLSLSIYIYMYIYIIGREEASPPLFVQFAEFSLCLFIYLFLYIG